MKQLLITIALIFSLIQVNAQTSTWDGTSSTWTNGNGTVDNPFLIETAAHLSYLSQQVVIGQTYNGQYFRLMTNINLNNLDWIPIGGRNMQGESSANAFAGVFDGNNKTISNIKINTPNKNNTGLFGYVESYSFNPEIRNLSVVSGTVNGNSSTGGIIGYLKGRVRNCSNGATVNGTGAAGGIVGMGSFGCEIVKCTNSGTVSGYSVGGIVETAYDCLIQNCNNSGSISGDYASGIVETVYGLIINCKNIGNISGGNIAGIARYDLTDGVIISSCVNTGNLTGTSTTGGIGSFIDESTSVIKNCYNVGTLNRGGGIVGKAEKCSIENCYNVGTISSTSNSGAIAGSVSNNAIITNCHYLNTCIATNNGYGTSQTSTNMKTQSFVNTLNASQNPSPWKIGGTQNNGYPILVVAPYVKTITATNISGNSATINGIVESGDETINSQGFRYKKYGTATYSNVSVNGTNISSSISCDPLSGYLFQVFAITSSGTYYGDELSFTTTSTGIEDVEQLKYVAYPNPATTEINIPNVLNNDRITHLRVFNCNGQLIKEELLDKTLEKITINVSAYQKGIYYYQINSYSGKFIVE